MHSLVMATACALEPDYFDEFQAALLSGGNAPGEKVKKNKKKKGKKTAAPSEERLAEEVLDDMMRIALEKLKKIVIEDGKGSDSRDWAASGSDEMIICALPALLNKKHFKKLSHFET